MLDGCIYRYEYNRACVPCYRFIMLHNTIQDIKMKLIGNFSGCYGLRIVGRDDPKDLTFEILVEPN